VQMKLPDGSTARGKVVGVDSDGALVLDSDGHRMRVVSGEVLLVRG
jgi:biotin-(acetyl-CoA carboxylase) ligase